MTIQDLSKWQVLAESEFMPADFCTAEYLASRWDVIKAWVLADCKDKWIGCGIIKFGHDVINPNGVHFLEICIFPEYRGKGYAKQLLKVMNEHAHGRKKSACVHPSNTASTATILGNGFLKTGTYKDWDVYTREN